MRILVVTDDRVGPVMAGSGLRAWELARVLLDADHEVVLAAGPGSSHPEGHGPTVVTRPRWRWAEVVVGAPWSLPPRAFVGRHLLVVDGVTPLLAELEAVAPSPLVRRRRRTAAARLPLASARADAVLVAGAAQRQWWRARLGRRAEVPLIEVPFGIPETAPPPEAGEIEGVPPGWQVILWWGGVWPWLDLETLLAARARLGAARVCVVVPTAARPGVSTALLSVSELRAAAGRHGLQPPQVLPLERWVPYSERHLVLNRAALLAVLHRPGAESELCFRTRALDGVWAAVPMLLSEGGAVAAIARAGSWGGVVPPQQAEAAAAAMHLLLGPREQGRCRRALASQQDRWRWPVVARPLVDLLPELPVARRGWLPEAALAATAALLAGPRAGGNR
jgi:hypothetical protein